jgi:hypothetical protein
MVIPVAAGALGLPITGWSAFAAPAIGRAYVGGIEDTKRIGVGSDFLVIFMLTILLAFVGNVLLGVTIWRSRTLPKWAGAIWIAWAVMFHVAGVLYGLLFTSSSPPTQPMGSLLMAVSGGVDTVERYTPTSSSTTTRSIKESQTCLNNYQMIIIIQLIV